MTYKVRNALEFVFQEHNFFCAPDRFVNRHGDRFANFKIENVPQNVALVLVLAMGPKTTQLLTNCLQNDCRNIC